jgi:hypothetical protein
MDKITKIVSFGCSFVAHSHDNENIDRQNRGIHTINHNNYNYNHYIRSMPETETNFTLELGEMLGVDTENYATGGSGVRSLSNKVIQYLDNNKVEDTFIIMGISDFSRFDFANTNINDKCPKLPIEDYVEYYDVGSVVFEIRGILKMLSCYLKSKKIPHLFINTLNSDYVISNVVDTLQFPSGTEFWNDHIKSYDSTYQLEHPNIDDHKKLAEIICKEYFNG